MADHKTSGGNGRRNTILVAGGTGFIGKHTVELLQQRGFQVILLMRRRSLAVTSSSTSSASSSRTKEIIVNHLNTFDPRAFEREIEPYVQQYKNTIGALVNLVGIKMEREPNKGGEGGVSFREAHVNVTRSLLQLSDMFEIPHLVHVSVLCARREEPLLTEGYHHTKWEAEQLILQHQQSKQASSSSSSPSFSYTIVRPSVVFGNGDDMIKNLIRSIKHLPVFPLPGDGLSIHQPVHVTDVARAVERAVLEGSGGYLYSSSPSSPSSFKYQNAIVEAVGPEKMTLRRMIDLVTKGTCLPTPILIPTPLAIEKVAAQVMVKAFDDPLITPTQLRMLSEGMSSNSDCDPIEIKTGDSPPPSPSLSSPSPSPSSGSSTFDTADSAPKVRLTPELVKGMEAGIGPFLGMSMRLFTDDRHYEWMESFGSTRPQKGSSSTLPLSGFVLFTFLSVLLLSGTSMFERAFLGEQEGKEAGTIWWRLLAVNIIVIPTCFWALNRMGGDWVSLLRPSLKSTLQAIVFASVCYVFSWVGMRSVEMVLSESKAAELVQEMIEIKNTRDLVSPGWGFMLLSCILIPGDELVWRCILLLPLCAYFNGASGTARGRVRKGTGSFGILSGEAGEVGGEDESPSSKSRRRDLGVLACLLSSVGWALAHKLFFDTWVVGFAAFTMGVMWSGFFLRTRSLYAVILTHLIWDTLTVYILPLF